MEKASLHGLTFRNDVQIDGDVLTGAISDSYKTFMRGTYSKLHRRYYRPIGQAADVRADGTHENVNETIDRSMFERWRDVPAYRPPNLVEWAARKKVDPGMLTTSVRADAVEVALPD